MQIAVVGGGPAGCTAASMLAGRGHDVTLIDSQAPWEKPCGGGVTTKVISRYGIFQTDLPRKQIEQITIYFGDERSVTVSPETPLAVVSRQELGKYLLAEAERAGVRVVHDRVSQIHSEGRKWRLAARENEFVADYLVGADGTTSMVRRAAGHPLPPEDLCVTVGYIIPADAPPQMKIFFVPGLAGYIWSFPRQNHISYGLITKSGPGWTQRAKSLLANFIVADLGTDVMEHAEFYSAPVPCLGPKAWKNNAVAGERWALVGDAAGLADPITGEGIYFAFRSAELLAETFERPGEYARAVWNDMGRELARASRMYRRFYTGNFLGADFRSRTVQLASRSRTIRHLVGNLMAGNQSYLNLKKKLFFSIPAVAWDLIAGRK